MASMTVRAAREDETEVLVRMYEWLFAPPGYRPSSWDADRARKALAEAIAAENSTVLVAEAADGELVGLISAYLELNSVRYGLRCWVEDLAVDPTRRSTGVGKALLDGAKGWARECGATHLELDTGLARQEAQHFYDREGPTTKGYSYSWML
jgi:GNAT superfamily N-acetyltransferase